MCVAAAGLVLCSTHADAVKEVFNKATVHCDAFRKILAVCVGVLRQRSALGGSGTSHLEDVIVALNYNDFYYSDAAKK